MQFHTILRTILILLIGLFTQPTFAEIEQKKIPYANRIVALSPQIVEMVFAIGAGEKIVGTVDSSDYPKAALSLPHIGNYATLDIERILQLKPDLIIALTGSNQQGVDKLKSLGIPVFYSSPKSLQELADELKKIGEYTGHQKRATEIADSIIHDYQKLLQTYATEKKITVFYQLWSDPLRTIGDNTAINQMISDCGGVNLFGENEVQSPIVSLETVLLKNPQVILIPAAPETLEEKSSIWQKWEQVDAVRNNKIVNINPALIHRITPRTVTGLKELCLAINLAR